MLRSVKALRGAAIDAADGGIGHLDDLLFDDQEWVARYLVADTGNWLPGRLVLLAPSSAALADGDPERLAVTLSREQIEQSPPLERDAPVSRQWQAEHNRYYGIPDYWAAWPAMGYPGVASPWITEPALPPDARSEPGVTAPHEGDPHLQSAHDVTGYHVKAADDEVGHVEDLILDSSDWTIRYLVLDTRNWLPGRKVLIAPGWVTSFAYPDRIARVGLTRAEIEGSPEFDPAAPVNRAYEEQLYDYYGRPAYWHDRETIAPPR